MNLPRNQQLLYDQLYNTMLSNPTIMKKKYGQNWKQVIHNISINNAKKIASTHLTDNSGDCPCCK